MNLRSVGSVGPTPASGTATLPESAPGFGSNLDALLRPTSGASSPTGVQFSRHASARMESRGVALDSADLSDLSDTIDRLAKRGAKESLVLMGEHAFIVGVPDRKVVTVLTRQEAAGNIFTHIDSTAVIR